MFFTLQQGTAFFEYHSRAALHAAVKVLRDIRKRPSPLCQIGFTKGAFQLLASLLKQGGYTLSHLLANGFTLSALLQLHDRKVGLVITLGGIPPLPLFRFTQNLACNGLIYVART